MLKHHKYYYKLLSGELEAQTAGGNHQSKLIFLLNVFLFLLLSSNGILHVLLLETFYFFREVGHLVLILATSSFLLILSQENTRMPSQTKIIKIFYFTHQNIYLLIQSFTDLYDLSPWYMIGSNFS